MEKYVISLDQGTTSSRALIIDKKGNLKGFSQREIKQYFPKSSWVEEDAYEIYESQISVLKESIKDIDVDKIDSIGITNQRETTILWNKNTGKPVYNAIVWQCKRGSSLCDKLIKNGLKELIHKKTGLVIDPYFSASKISWILENVDGVREQAEKGEILFGTVDTWLLWNLTGGKVHLTDYTNASRTMLYNIKSLEWDDELLDIFNIPKSILPKVQKSSSDFGLIEEDIIGREVPVYSMVGDQQSALFGQLCTQVGESKNTYGTGCFTLMNIGEMPILSKNGLLTTIAAFTGDKITYAFEGSVFVGGAAIQWLRDEMGLISSAQESEEIAITVSDTNGLTFVSTFQGVGTPYWKSGVTGEITGITRGCNRAHIVRAALESIAFRSLEVITTMENDSNVKIRNVKVDGGASKNNFLMQFQSDILNSNITRPGNIESTALGAAYLAGLFSGYWKDIDELKELKSIDREFLPMMTKEDRDQNINRWQKAIHKAIT